MTIDERIEKLLKARNILHKKENGEKFGPNDLIIAHDLVDMVIDDMVDENFKARKR
jgi:hypothetical protein